MTPVWGQKPPIPASDESEKVMRVVLSDSDIAEKSIAQIKKNRVVRTLKSRQGNVGGGITRGLRKHSRTSDTFLRQ